MPSLYPDPPMEFRVLAFRSSFVVIFYNPVPKNITDPKKRNYIEALGPRFFILQAP